MESKEKVTRKKLTKEQGLKVANFALTAAAVALPLLNGVCYADTMSDIFGKVLNLIYFTFRAIGGILFIYGFGLLILGFRNEDSESKVRSIFPLVCGAVLFGFPNLAKSLGISASSFSFNL